MCGEGVTAASGALGRLVFFFAMRPSRTRCNGHATLCSQGARAQGGGVALAVPGRDAPPPPEASGPATSRILFEPAPSTPNPTPLVGGALCRAEPSGEQHGHRAPTTGGHRSAATPPPPPPPQDAGLGRLRAAASGLATLGPEHGEREAATLWWPPIP